MEQRMRLFNRRMRNHVQHKMQTEALREYDTHVREYLEHITTPHRQLDCLKTQNYQTEKEFTLANLLDDEHVIMMVNNSEFIVRNIQSDKIVESIPLRETSVMIPVTKDIIQFIDTQQNRTELYYWRSKSSTHLNDARILMVFSHFMLFAKPWAPLMMMNLLTKEVTAVLSSSFDFIGSCECLPNFRIILFCERSNFTVHDFRTGEQVFQFHARARCDDMKLIDSSRVLCQLLRYDLSLTTFETSFSVYNYQNGQHLYKFDDLQIGFVLNPYLVCVDRMAGRVIFIHNESYSFEQELKFAPIYEIFFRNKTGELMVSLSEESKYIILIKMFTKLLDIRRSLIRCTSFKDVTIYTYSS